MHELLRTYIVPLFEPAVLLFFLGACAGHAVLVVMHMNCLYGRPLPRRLLRYLRRFCELLCFSGPVLFLYAVGWWHVAPADWPPAVHLLYTYGLCCLVLGLGLLPALTLVRWLRDKPRALLSNHTDIVDVAKELGYRPIGRGKYRHLARLPYNQVFEVDFSVRTYALPQLPAAWDGLSILHLTDLHLCGTPDRTFYQHVVERCNDWRPDIVAVTGDVVDSFKHHRWVVPVLGRLKWKIAAFAILGNHDTWYEPDRVRRRLRKLGMNVIGNTWKQIDVHGQPLVVVGHEGPWFGPVPDLSNCPPDVFRLCLSHTPDNIAWARENRMDVMLAGHVHGGQIRFPLIGSVFVPSRYSRRYDCGSFHEPPTLMHVSRGLAGQHPLRYNCRPEATLIVLKKG